MPTAVGAEADSGGCAPPPFKPAVPLDVDQYLSQEGRARVQGTLRSLAGQFAGIPGIVSLSGGFPPASLFPFSGMTLHLATGGSVTINDPAAVRRLLLVCWQA